MTIDVFGILIDLSALRIPVSVAVALIALLLVFFLTSTFVRVVLMIVFLVAVGLIGWWALESFGIV